MYAVFSHVLGPLSVHYARDFGLFSSGRRHFVSFIILGALTLRHLVSTMEDSYVILAQGETIFLVISADFRAQVPRSKSL